MKLDEWKKAPKVHIEIVMDIPVAGAPKRGEVVEAVRVPKEGRGQVKWWVKGEPLKPIGVLSREAAELGVLVLCLKCKGPVVDPESGYCDTCKDGMGGAA